VLAERSLMPGDGARLGAIRFDAWLQQPPKEAAQSPRGDLRRRHAARRGRHPV